MTNEEIERVAERVSQLVLQGILQGQEVISHIDEEQSLLTELAGAMTALDFQLEAENYIACDELKKQIIKIENKLNKFK